MKTISDMIRERKQECQSQRLRRHIERVSCLALIAAALSLAIFAALLTITWAIAQ